MGLPMPKEEVAEKKLLIVEDVVTSGGQIIESARALRCEGESSPTLSV